MICAWKELMGILPARLRCRMEPYQEQAQEIRLRLGEPAEVVTGKGNFFPEENITEDELNFVINSASRYSPWNAATIAQGYLTGPGGHRIGICGETVMKEGRISGIRRITSLCIRIARDIPGLAEPLAGLGGSVLILGAPGWGKTTLLRDFIRQKSKQGRHISVVDERGEIFPQGINRGPCTEVLTGCPKAQGIDMVLRTMGPDMIAMDEITATEDCEALHQAAWCGVALIATAHAGSLQEYLHRQIYSPLVRDHLFDHLVILHPDKHWHLERSGTWTTNGSVRY